MKNTANLIPLAHAGVVVEGCAIDLSLFDPEKKPEKEKGKVVQYGNVNGIVDEEENGSRGGVKIEVEVQTTAKTGVEMEALTGVMGAALTVVDMCKSADKGIVIKDVKVVGKKGGKSGSWGCFAEGTEAGADKGIDGIDTGDRKWRWSNRHN